MKNTDFKILELLKQNARLSTNDIAESVNLSEKEVQNSIKEMEDRGIILQYTTVVNEKKIPKKSEKVRALIELKVRPEKKAGFGNIAKKISKYPNVVGHFLLSGGFDFLLIVEGESLIDISNFVANKLAPIENIQSTVTHFVMRIYKEKGVLIEDPSSDNRLAISA